MSREAGGVLVIVAGIALMIAAINGSLQRAFAQLVTSDGSAGQVRAVGDIAGGGDGSQVRAIGNADQTGAAPEPKRFPFDPYTQYYYPPGYPGSGVRTATG